MTAEYRQKLLWIAISSMTLAFFIIVLTIAGGLVAPHCWLNRHVYGVACMAKMGDAAGYAAAGGSWALLWHLLDLCQVGHPAGRIPRTLSSYGLVYGLWIFVAILVTLTTAGPYPLLIDGLPVDGDLFTERWVYDDPLLERAEPIFSWLTMLILAAKAWVSLRSRFQNAK